MLLLDRHLFPASLDEPSHEPYGPFGAKSIGEVVCNTPVPAIAAAIHNAIGGYFRTLPSSGESVLLSMPYLKEEQS